MPDQYDHTLLNDSFNSRSRDGSDNASLIISRPIIKVSIHAPVMGATGLAAYHDSQRHYQVSIHAPVMGATLMDKAVIAGHARFNSRSRDGSD